MNRKYKIVAHSTEYSRRFRVIAESLQQIFGDAIVLIEHVGSTSVPGLGGKPCIDVAVVVKDMRGIDQHKALLEKMGYTPLGEYAVKGETLFVKDKNQERVENIHFFPVGHPEFEQMIKVREYLKAHPTDVSDYYAYKQKISGQDYGVYRKKKDEYFQHILEKALRWSQ